MDYRLQSPYCSGFKVPVQQKGLIVQHLLVRKLTRRELEDKYLRLIDENYDLKRENNVQKEKIKILTTKLLRLTKENSRYKSREFLFLDENNEIHEAEEFFRGRRPASSSAIPRKSFGDNMRGSTPNLSKFKSEISLDENMSKSHGNSNTNENSGINADSIKEMQDEIERLTDELRKLQEVREIEKHTNEQLEIQINELKDKLIGKKMQLELETSVEIAELNKKIKELQFEMREMEVNYKRMLDESQNENEKLSETLERERNKSKRYEAQASDLESSQKLIEELMQQITQYENDKANLVGQHDKYAAMTEEVLTYKTQMKEMVSMLAQKEQELEKEKADRASIEHSQEELLEKMKNLQKENDHLVVKLEGLITENDNLISKNQNLESRIKVLENENISHLKQLNETLKLPTAIKRDDENAIASFAKEIHKIQERQVVKQMSVELTSPDNSLASSQPSSRRVSVASTRLSVPSVVFDDEKRPASSEKQLKIIPTIIEPSTSDAGQAVVVDEDQQIADKAKVFAETFSQSISKDEPEGEPEDEFDPKTFSIDQNKQIKKEFQRVVTAEASTSAFTAAPSRLSLWDSAVERAKCLLIKDIFEQSSTSKGRLQHPKKVRMSIDAKTFSPIYTPRQSGFSISDLPQVKLMQYSAKIENVSRTRPHETERESLAEYMERSSSQTSAGSLSSRRKSGGSRIPSILLDHIDDEKLLLKYSTHNIEIEISKLELCENSSLLEDEKSKFLYVEYTFMNYKGYLLETQSLQKPKKAGDATHYKLKRKFDINPADEEFKVLKTMICKDSNNPVRFLIVSEPLDDEGQPCEEVGFATVKLNEVIEKAKSDSLTIKADCYSTAYPHELIAYLYIKITGIEILKKLSMM